MGMLTGEGEGGGAAIETHSGEEGWPRRRLQLETLVLVLLMLVLLMLMLVHFFLVALYWCVIFKIENWNEIGDDDDYNDGDTIGWPPILL